MASRYFALIPCAGVGSRSGLAIPKQYHCISGKPLLYYSLRTFHETGLFTRVLLVLASHDRGFQKEDYTDLAFQAERCGGATRQDSVWNGLMYLKAQGAQADDWILVHDAARPGLDGALIQKLVDALKDDIVGGIVALPVADTLKRVEQQQILTTEAREGLWQAQTPQMFRFGVLEQALYKAQQAGFAVTDEASAVEYLGLSPKIVQGHLRNFKVTFPEDFALAQACLAAKINVEGKGMMRIGQGYDVHQLVEGRALILGGVLIPFDKGLLGHSDADVLLHAITDALLGAAALGDIGRHFSDTDQRYKDVDSRLLLKEVVKRVRELGYQIQNVDSTLIAQKPKLAPYIDQMIQTIAEDLAISPTAVNIKAKTNEELGYLGQSQAIEAQAVVLLTQ